MIAKGNSVKIGSENMYTLLGKTLCLKIRFLSPSPQANFNTTDSFPKSTKIAMFEGL